MKKLIYHIKEIEWESVGQIVAIVFLSLGCLSYVGFFVHTAISYKEMPKHTHKLEIVAIDSMEHTMGLSLYGFGAIWGKGKAVFYVKTDDTDNVEVFPYEVKLKKCKIFLSDESYILYKHPTESNDCEQREYPTTFDKNCLTDTIYISKELLQGN